MLLCLLTLTIQSPYATILVGRWLAGTWSASVVSFFAYIINAGHVQTVHVQGLVLTPTFALSPCAVWPCLNLECALQLYLLRIFVFIVEIGIGASRMPGSFFLKFLYTDE